jgi:PAS domain S-box-containing protein
VAIKKEPTKAKLLSENEELRSRLAEAEETLDAIRQGEVDALVVSGPHGDQVYALQGAEHTYRRLVESINEGALTLTEDGNIIYCNRAFAEILGVTSGMLIGMPFRDLVAKQDKKQFEKLWICALEAHTKAEMDLHFKGLTIQAYVSASTLLSEGECCVFVVVTDISERKSTEAELANYRLHLEQMVDNKTRALQAAYEELQAVNEELHTVNKEFEAANEELIVTNDELALKKAEFEAMINSISDAVIYSDPKMRMLLVNPVATAMFGYSIDELVGKTPEILHADQGDFTRIAKDQYNVNDRVLQPPFESRYRRKDGTEFIGETRVAQVRTSLGVLVGFISIRRDITKRKQAEEALQESEDRFRLLITASSDVIYSMSPDWSEMRQLLGRNFISDTEKPNRNWIQEYIHPDDHSNVKSVIDEAIRTKSIFELIHRVVLVDGTLGWTFSRAIPRLDSNGEIVEWFGAASDITERKRAEEALKTLNEELENRVAERTTELSAINASLTAQIEIRKQAERRIFRLNQLYSILSNVNETIVRVRDPEELYRQVCRIVVDYGLFQMAWIGLIDANTLMVHPVTSCGDRAGYLDGVKVYAADVPEGQGPTGRATFEGKYSISGDVAQDPRMLPWREKALQHGLRSSAAFPLQSGSKVIGALTVYSDSPQFFTDEETQLLTSLVDNVSFALDFMGSEQKRIEAEEELKRINEELEQRITLRTADLEAANRELEAFSYSVSHDLRAPLRHISGFIELLMKKNRDNADEETLRYTNLIAAASKNMGLLIDDLLNFSQLGRTELKKRKVNLNVLIKDVVKEIQETLKGREIKWEMAELPDVLGDQSLLRLAIVNLISNAVKFTSTRQHAEIRIGCKEGVDKFTCSIADNGVGFDMKYADRLFGVFQRLHAKDEFEGTGIGLANVQRIISRHGGRVWAEGVVGQGATFYFTLPKSNNA